MANAVRQKTRVQLVVFLEDGIGESGIAAHSWHSLSFFERFGHVLSSLTGRALWHLWGAPPSWWPFVQLRSRTVHTLLDTNFGQVRQDWRGHPSRIFHSQAHEGESVLVPTFEARVAHTLSVSDYDRGLARDDSAPAIYVGLKSASPALKEALCLPLPVPTSGANEVDVQDVGAELVNTDEFFLGTDSTRSGVLIAGTSASDAIRAAVMTVRGLVVVGQSSPYLDELLGRDGYLSPRVDTPDEWRRVLQNALSPLSPERGTGRIGHTGRTLGPSVRYFIKTRYSSERCADSVTLLYSEVMRKA